MIGLPNSFIPLTQRWFFLLALCRVLLALPVLLKVLPAFVEEIGVVAAPGGPKFMCGEERGLGEVWGVLLLGMEEMLLGELIRFIEGEGEGEAEAEAEAEVGLKSNVELAFGALAFVLAKGEGGMSCSAWRRRPRCFSNNTARESSSLQA